MSDRKQSPRVKMIRELARGIAREAVRELKKAEFIATTKDEEREMQDIVEYVARRELARLPVIETSYTMEQSDGVEAAESAIEEAHRTPRALIDSATKLTSEPGPAA